MWSQFVGEEILEGSRFSTNVVGGPPDPVLLAIAMLLFLTEIASGC
jgi:hypothetical protein